MNRRGFLGYCSAAILGFFIPWKLSKSKPPRYEEYDNIVMHCKNGHLYNLPSITPYSEEQRRVLYAARHYKKMYAPNGIKEENERWGVFSIVEPGPGKGLFVFRNKNHYYEV